MRRALSLRTILTTVAAAGATMAVLTPAAAAATKPAGPSTAASSQIVAGASVTVSGTFHHLAVDGSGHRNGFESDIIASGKQLFNVKLAKGQQAREGDKVSVTGNLAGTTVTNATVAAQPSTTKGGKGGGSTPTPTPTPTTTTTTTTPTPPAAHMDRVLVILATWGQPDSVTPASARQQFF